MDNSGGVYEVEAGVRSGEFEQTVDYGGTTAIDAGEDVFDQGLDPWIC
jgi:hypothetical protein